MFINKITAGFVIQTFDTDKQEWTQQSFVAGDQVEYETGDLETKTLSLDEFEDKITTGSAYLPFDMVQPRTPFNSCSSGGPHKANYDSACAKDDNNVVEVSCCNCDKKGTYKLSEICFSTDTGGEISWEN